LAQGNAFWVRTLKNGRDFGTGKHNLGKTPKKGGDLDSRKHNLG